VRGPKPSNSEILVRDEVEEKGMFSICSIPNEQFTGNFFYCHPLRTNVDVF
jgi:hypothetical protein